MESKCGPGSTLKATQKLRAYLKEAVKKYNIQTINDAGCGDLFWILHTDLDIDYCGYDDNLRDIAKERAVEKGWELHKIDLLSEKMRPCDLVICKDVMRHHDNEGIEAIISNLNCKYLLADYNDEDVNTGKHHRDVGENLYSVLGNRVNLTTILGEPEESFISDEEGKRFGLWKLMQ